MDSSSLTYGYPSAREKIPYNAHSRDESPMHVTINSHNNYNHTQPYVVLQVCMYKHNLTVGIGSGRPWLATAVSMARPAGQASAVCLGALGQVGSCSPRVPGERVWTGTLLLDVFPDM